jgi:F-type H+-transporting ATPase subunit alpha
VVRLQRFPLSKPRWVITDGQIFLETDLFNSGQRPALNVGISVSRVGGNAQIGAMKKVAGGMRLDLAQYRELAAFAQFGSDLDAETQNQLTRGKILYEVLKQNQFAPMIVEKLIAIFYAASRGFLDAIAPADIRRFEREFLENMEANQPDLLKQIATEGKLTDEIDAALNKTVSDFVKGFVA